MNLNEFYFLMTTPARLYVDLAKLTAEERRALRSEKLMRRIITQGNFYKISLMLTYFFADHPEVFRTHMRAKITKCDNGTGAQIHLNWDGNADQAEITKEEIEAWFDVVFA
jgi:hypothetical protein